MRLALKAFAAAAANFSGGFIWKSHETDCTLSFSFQHLLKKTRIRS
jgi:hypothetical protein